MEALLDCIDEIALDGLDGCPILELWKHLEERTPPFPLMLDDAAKQFLWKGIVQTPEVEFFVLTEPLVHLFGAKCDSSSDKDKSKPNNPLDQFQGPLRDSNKFKLVSEQGIKGSCPSYFVRKNVTKDIQGQAADYLHLKAAYERLVVPHCASHQQKWGDCLVMVASQELREKALFGVNRDPNISIVEMQYCLLEHVGQARYNGRMQRAIGSNYVQIESKTIFHHLKRLRQLHLITMQPVVITTSDPSKSAISKGVRNFNTNIVRLKRFHVQQYHKYDVLAANLCKLLLDSENQELPLIDILKHFNESKKMVRKVRQFLQQAGYVVEEKIEETSEGDSKDCCPPKSKKKKKESLTGTTVYTIKVRLVKPFVLKTDSIWQPSDDDEEDDDDDDVDDDDDDDDVDREKDAFGDDCYSNLIAEKPLVNQVYNVIWQAGSRGCTLRKCQRNCRLPFYDVRIFVKNLKKKNLVQEVHQDIAKMRVRWFVATPFVERNAQTMKVKQMQDQLKQMETEAAESHIPAETPMASVLPSSCPPPALSEGGDGKEKKPMRSKSLIAERVTYRKLKRKKVILEYLQNMKVVEGTYSFQKAIISSEEEEGHMGKIDRKVLFRFLDDLIAEGLIRQLKTVIHHGTLSQTVDLFLHSSITNDHPAVAHALEQCRVRMRDESYKAAERQEKARQIAEEKERRKLEKARTSEEKEKKKLENEASKKKDKDETKTKLKYKISTFKYGFLPRFPRIQVMHELMWKLVYGHFTQESLHVVDNGQREGSYDQNSYEWLKHLKPLAKVHDADGWFHFSDVFAVMPLIILCKTIDITEEIEGLDEYALDPVKKYTLICDLPQPLKSRVIECRKVKAAPQDLLTNMSQMGLITPSLPFPSCFRNVKMFLNKGLKLLDTTVSLPAWHTTCPPPGKSFALRTHMFTSMAAVQSYWSDLKCVCLNTPLGVLRNQEGSNETVPLASKDRRLVFFAKEEVDKNRLDLPPGDQLGAGGLDRGLFGHLQKNWTRLMTRSLLSPQAVVQEKRKLPTTTTIMAAEADVVNSGSVLPGVERVSVGRAETKKQAKKGSLKQQKKKRKRNAEDSDQFEGVKKSRPNSSEKTNNSEQKKSNQQPKTGHLNAIDEEDRNILARKAAERISFSVEEDSWLLLFRIALGIMKNETSRFYPFVCMRNILHNTCASSFDKTAPSIQRRILKLLKNPQSQMTVKICAAECAHDESFGGFDDPNDEFEGTFKEVVKRLRQKFSSSSLSCDGDLTLVSSVKELHDKYKVQTLVCKDTCLSDQNIVSMGPVVKSVSDVNKAAIRDQIQIAFTTPRELYDAYRVFQMFNSFTREELHDVFQEMQKKNLVSRKKPFENPTSQLTRSLPFASMTYQLSFAYHRLFLQGFKLITFFRDCAKFWSQLLNGEQHTLQDPRTTTTTTTDSCSNKETSEILTPGTMEVKAKNTYGGDVACILSLLATNQVSVEVNIPDEILNLDQSEQITDTQQQTSQETPDGLPRVQLPADASYEESSYFSPQKIKAQDTSEMTQRKEKPPNEGTEKNQLSSPTASTQRRTSSKVVQSPSSMKEKAPPEKWERRNVMPKSHGKGKTGTSSSITKEKRLEKRELLILNLPSSTVTKFASAYDLTSVKENGNYLTSCTETVEVQQKTAQVSKVSTVPVASLTYNSTTSRSSRTALMLARGGKDPYVSINQLPARAVNTHDFMTLHHCKNLLRLINVSDGKVQTPTTEKGLGRTTALSQSATNEVRSTSFDDILDNTVTSPVIVSTAMSIEQYVELRKRELDFNETDAVLARDIHNLVGKRRELGFPMALLQERIHESHEQELNSSQYPVQEHVKYLCAAKLLYKVGFYELCLVTASFVKPWCLKLLKPKSSSEESKAGKDVGDKSDSLNSKNTYSANDVSIQEGETKSRSEGEKNGSEITGIITEDTTSQTGSFSTHVITECSASSSLDPDTLHWENSDDTTKNPNERTDLSSEPVDGSSSKEMEESEVQRKKSKVRNFQQYSVVCRPWITIDGTTSQRLLRMFREMVLMLILDNPGIPEGQIAKHVFEALRPAALHDILESLILDGCIVKHVQQLPPKMSLFIASKPMEPTKTTTFYTPTVDCILKLATIKRTGYT